MTKAKFICKAPWVSIAFQPSGKVGPCCLYELDNLSELASPVEATFLHERAEFLNGNVPQGCKKCHESFLNSGKSAANSFEQYRTDFDQVLIQEINVKSNNICNLACRSCGPHFSSKWEEEFSTVVKISKDDAVLSKVKLIDVSALKTVVVAGGEPTLTQEHVELLQYLIDVGRTEITVKIATNLTSLKYKSVDLIELWKKFPNMYLQASIDAIGDRAVAIRSGTNWDLLEKNLKEIINSKISFYVIITVSALNIWFLEDTLLYLKKTFDIKNIKFNLLIGPEELNVQVIPSEYRDDLNTMLDRCTALGYNINQVKTYFNSNQKVDLWPKFIIYNLMLDRTRNENFFDLLPIKQRLINQWLKL